MEYEKLLNLGTELGYQLMYSGAEIYRVEESVFRLLCAYGLQPQVFAIPNCLIVCIQTPDGRPMTGMRRIPPHGTDIELLEACNDLCRRLCRNTLPVSQAREELDRLSAGHRAHSLKTLLFGYTITSAFFAAFFGGGLPDALCAALCGLAVGAWMLHFSKSAHVGGFFKTLIGAAIASLMALLFTELWPQGNLYAVTIGTLMVLVPGMALTNAMREVMAGDILSGLNRTADSILTAVAISLGVLLSLTITL